MMPDEVLAKARAHLEFLKENKWHGDQRCMEDLIALAEQRGSQIVEMGDLIISKQAEVESLQKCLLDDYRRIEQLQEALVEATAKYIALSGWYVDDWDGLKEEEDPELAEENIHGRDFYREQARQELSIKPRPRFTAAEKEALEIATRFMQSERNRLKKIDKRTISFMIGDQDAIAVLLKMLEE